jgi:hypothetical protein
MKKLLVKYTWFVFVIGLAGCSSIDFYEVKSDGTQVDSGFLYYPSKPYLLVETKSDKTVTSIISLPDLSRPHRVKQDNGWGSAELGFEIENGMIKSFNSKTDSKGPETLTSIAGLGTAQAALATAEAAQLTAELSAGDSQKMMAVPGGPKTDVPNNYNVKVFIDAATALKSDVLPILEKNDSKLSYEIESVKQVIAIVESNQKIDFNPAAPDALLTAVEERRKIAGKQAGILKNVFSTLTVYAENKAEEPPLILIAKNANDELKLVIKSLLAFSLRSTSTNGLYEINFINGRLNLRKVVFE